MVKESKARATRQDPVQESLVSKKDEINRRTSDLIDLLDDAKSGLIDSKNVWNGKPAPRIGVTEPHSLKEPIPSEATDTMSKVVQIIGEANSIIGDIDSKLTTIDNEQAGYERNRRQPQPKKMPDSPPPSPSQEDEGGLDLSAIASSSVSRFMSHIKAPFQFGDSNKWGRLRLLRAAARVNTHLEEMQSFVLSSDDMAIPNAVYKARDLLYIFDNEISEPMLSALRDMPEKPKAPAGDDKPDDKPADKKKDKTKEEPSEEPSQEPLQDQPDEDPYQEPGGGIIDIGEQVQNANTEIMVAARRLDTPELRKEFKERYSDLVRRVDHILSLLASEPAQAQEAYMSFVPLKDEFVQAINSATPNQDYNIEVTANRFTNFLKRKNVQSSSDHMRGLKLKADQSITSTRGSLDELMNALQKSHVNPGSLTTYLSKTVSDLKELYKTLFKLGDIHNSKAKVKNYKSKGKDKWPVVSSTDLRGLFKAIKELEGIDMKIESLQESRG